MKRDLQRLGAVTFLLTISLTTACSSDDAAGDGGTDGSAADGATEGGAVDTAALDGAEAGLGPCGIAEPEPNDNRDQATPYVVGTSVAGCVGSDTDHDFYVLTAPADPAGGYYTASLSNVGNGMIQAVVYTASDNSAILENNYTDTNGATLNFYWAAAPGQTYRIDVSRFSSTDPFLYTLKADYTKINDAFEPNDTRDQAKPLTLATPTAGYFFAGFSAGALAAPAYLDWFSTTLAAGMVTIKLDNVATDVQPQIELQDPMGNTVDIGTAYNTTAGGSLNLTGTLTAAGAYKLSVGLFSIVPKASDHAVMVPDSFTRPYQLTVTQP